MKKLNIAASGFPGTNKTLRFINEMVHEPLSAIAGLCGEKTIIYGVEDKGKGSYTDGWIAVSGELYYFKEGKYSEKVVLYKNVEKADYNVTGTETSELPAYVDKLAKFKSSADVGLIDAVEFDFSELTRLKSLKDLNKQATEENKGLIEIATQGEFNLGKDDERAITTKKLHDSSFIRRVASGKFTVTFNNVAPTFTNISGDIEQMGMSQGYSTSDLDVFTLRTSGDVQGGFAVVNVVFYDRGGRFFSSNFEIKYLGFVDNHVAFFSMPKTQPGGLGKAVVGINFLA